MEPFENDIINCITALKQGGTFLYPTDTIWGLGCDATDANAVEKISALKNRPEHKSFIVLMADVAMLRKYLRNPISDLENFVEKQEGATTIIYDGIRGIAENTLAQDGSLGIRIPKDTFCLAFLNRYQKPILSTSANLSGSASPSFYKEINEVIKERVDYSVVWRQDDETPKTPSSIIKLNADGSILKIR